MWDISFFPPELLLHTLKTYFSYIWSKLKRTRSQITFNLYVSNWKSSYDVMLVICQSRQQHFAPAGTTFTQLEVWWLHPFLCYGEYTYNYKLKKFCEMLLTTLTYNQHDVIWRLPVWNVKIKRYLALCTLQFWSNSTKISFHNVKILPLFCSQLQFWFKNL
jgi:hypothetical protein